MNKNLNGELIEQCANFNIFQTEHNGYTIIYRVWKNGKTEFKITAYLINSGLATVSSGILKADKEYWIDPYKRG